MKKTIGILSLIAMIGVAAPAFAEDFPATPLSPAAPTNLPGEALIPGLPEAVAVVNGVTQPILQPLLVPGAVAAAPEATPIHHRHHHRHLASRHHARHVG